MKTLCRFYLQFYQYYMQSLIHFFLRLNLDSLFLLIILYKSRGIVDEGPLDRTANLLP